MTELDDVHRLREELQKLHEQKAEVNERLNSWNGGRGRGRGMPPPPMHDNPLRSRAPPGQRTDDRPSGDAARPNSFRKRSNDGPQTDRYEDNRTLGQRTQVVSICRRSCTTDDRSFSSPVGWVLIGGYQTMITWKHSCKRKLLSRVVCVYLHAGTSFAIGAK